MNKIINEYIGDGIETTFSYSEIGDNIIGVVTSVNGIQNTDFTMDTTNSNLVFTVAPIGIIVITAELYVNNLTSPTNGEGIHLDTTNFDNNLDNTVTDVQKLGDAVDELTSGPILLGETTTLKTLLGIDTNLVSYRYITAVGERALKLNYSGQYNVAYGADSLYKNYSGHKNTGHGAFSGYSNTAEENNSSFGFRSNYSNTSPFNTAIGSYALQNNITGYKNSALGYNAGPISGSSNFINCTYLGANSTTTGSNQVQLGDSSTTTYAYGGVVDRSDERDKSDIIDNPLGLEFISKIQPVQFKWDYREDYFNEVEDENGNLVKEFYEKDGSKKRSRSHNGVIAQQVKVVMDELGEDFAGYKDASLDGGKDVLSINYEEFISPMIKAIQELKARIEILENK